MRNRVLTVIQFALFPLFDTANQICMKYLGLVTGEQEFGLDWLKLVVLSPYWWGAMVADVGSFLMWMLILKKAKLSFATPFISVQYITILIASYFLFHEAIAAPHVIGVAFIIFGLVMIGWDELKGGVSVPR